MPEISHRNSLKPGHRLHWYVIERVLGQGGFGITYLAHDTNLQHHVAIKEYLPMELAVREGDDSVYPATEKQGERYKWGLERFLAEARTLAKFRHPSIVRVLSVFEDNNTAYMVMEYEPGENLQELLTSRKTLEEAELMKLLVPLLGGLEAIHDAGFVHRDIKPANIVIRRDGTPVLLDFGSARQALGQETRTLTSVVSPGYAPFEQYYSKSDRQGPWTDIYGLAATLYRAIAGRAPMDAIDRSEAILKAERDVFVPATDVGKGRYSRRFLEAVDHALQFRENKRPQSVEAWQAEFGISGRGNVETEILTAGLEDDPRTNFVLGDMVLEPTGPQAAAERIDSPGGRTRERAAPPSGPAAGRRRNTALRAAAVAAVLLAGGYFGLRHLFTDPGAGRSPVAALGERAGADGDSAPWWQVLLGGRTGDETPPAPRPPDPKRRAQQIETLLDQARLALNAGRILEPPGLNALALYEQVLALDPGNEAATRALGDVVNRLASLASEALASNDLERAQSLIDQAERLEPDSPLLAAVRAHLGRLREEQASAQALQAKVQTLLAAAAAARDAGRLAAPEGASAVDYYRRVLDEDPANAEAENGITGIVDQIVAAGDGALDARDFPAAKIHLEQASKIRPDAGAVARLAERYASLGGSAAGEAKAREVEALLNRAEEDFEHLRLSSPARDNALYRYREVLKLEPDNAEAARGIRAIVDKYVELAQSAMAAGELDQAEGYVASAERISPDAPGLKLAREALALRRGEPASRVQPVRAARAPAPGLAGEAERLRQMSQAQAVGSPRSSGEEDPPRAEADDAQRVAAGEALPRAEREPSATVVARAPGIVLAFEGLEDRYARFGLIESSLRPQIELSLRNAGYRVLARDQAPAAGDARLMEIELRASYSETQGTYSYAARVDVRDRAAPTGDAFTARPDWTRSENGVVRSSDFGRVRAVLLGFVDRYLREHPAR
jgi:serine/threonine protein kinase/tetratricopeptide (TPR) repeat protein